MKKALILGLILAFCLGNSTTVHAQKKMKSIKYQFRMHPDDIKITTTPSSEDVSTVTEYNLIFIPGGAIIVSTDMYSEIEEYLPSDANERGCKYVVLGGPKIKARSMFSKKACKEIAKKTGKRIDKIPVFNCTSISKNDCKK